MSSVGRKPGKGSAAMVATCREWLGDRAAKREADIAALPLVEWKGRTLRTIRCHGTTGKGPHDMNVPEDTLWALISIEDWHCPFHPR